MARDMELVERLDELGYDEAGSASTIPRVGDHRLAGGVHRRRHRAHALIRLGSGVTSLPYHHPLMVANRFVQLDHMSRGRTMLGCGPGRCRPTPT